MRRMCETVRARRTCWWIATIPSASSANPAASAAGTARVRHPREPALSIERNAVMKEILPFFLGSFGLGLFCQKKPLVKGEAAK